MSKRQLPFVASNRLFDLAGLGKVALEPVGNCNFSTGFFAYFHAAGAEAASRGYIHFKLRLGKDDARPFWTAKPVNFDLAAGPELDRLIAAVGRLIADLMAANPLTFYHQVSGAVGNELAEERRRAGWSLREPSPEQQARISLMRRLDAALRGWSNAWQGKTEPSLTSVIDDVLERKAA